jgi:hypothetical protein
VSAQTTNLQTGNTNMVAVAMLSCGTLIHYEVPFLEDADGYAHWHFCVMMVPYESNLMEAVNSTLTMLNAITNPVGHADWMSKDCHDCIQITTTLHKSTLNLIL